MARERRALDTGLLSMALVLGLASGLIEGVGHMVLQKIGVLENVWYQIIWIAAVVNAVLIGAVGLILSLALPRISSRPQLARASAFFILMFAACLPVLALMLKEWIHTYAILILTVGIAVAFTRWAGRHEPALLGFFRRGLPYVAGVFLLVFAGIQGGFWLNERRATGNLPAATRSAPNVLVVVIDALRADHLSSYGYGRQTSPAIDRLAAQGVIFEQAYSTSSYTLPSHASLISGLYPHQHGVEWGASRGTTSYLTVGDALQAQGYRTGAFSGNTFWFTRAHGFGRGFLHFDDFFYSVADMILRTAYGRMATIAMQRRLGYPDIPARRRAPDTNRAVATWVGADTTHPFFVFINYMDVHDPYLPPQPYRSRFSKEPAPGGLLNWELHVPDTLTPSQLQGEIDAYDGSIAYVDDHLDQLISALQARDPGRELIVAITSDHGEEFGEHGGFLHGSHLYRELIQVPLIVWQSRRTSGGTRVSQPVTNAALPATIMRFAGVDASPFPGPPLQRLWEPQVSPLEWPLPLSESKQRPWAPARQPVHSGSLRSLVDPTWHFIEHDTLGRALFNLANDHREATNLATSPEMQAVVDRFRSALITGPR